jgi:hypothetical protein
LTVPDAEMALLATRIRQRLAGVGALEVP